jgi:hypothetical protein
MKSKIIKTPAAVGKLMATLTTFNELTNRNTARVRELIAKHSAGAKLGSKGTSTLKDEIQADNAKMDALSSRLKREVEAVKKRFKVGKDLAYGLPIQLQIASCQLAEKMLVSARDELEELKAA